MRKFLLLLLVSASAWALPKDTIPLQTQVPNSEKDTGAILAPRPNREAIDKTDAAPPAASEPKAYIASLSAYGSPRVNEAVLKELLGKDLDLWIKKGLASDNSAMKIEKKLISKIKDKFGFPFAEWSVIQYFEPGQLALHLTLDVVEEKDKARRMPFTETPSGASKDPDGLLAAWRDYERTAIALVQAGELDPESEPCVALHCPFGHKQEKLKKFEKIFLDGVKKNGPALVEVQKNDKKAENRAAATYVLAYWIDQKKKVVDAMIDRLKDPDALVRNNALRVLGDIAEFHKEVLIPLAPLVPAMNFPRVSDRSKALYVVYLLAMNSSQVREELLKNDIPQLITLMECRQPDHRDLAHKLLRRLSGKDFPETDIKSWVAWQKKLVQPSEISKK